MAGSSAASMKLELPSTPVQELIKTIDDDQHIPERYINHIENRDHNSEVSEGGYEVSYMDTNIINLELLSAAASSSPQGQFEMENFRSILNSWGCFQLTNHGINSLMGKVREVAKQFFALPFEEKQKYARTSDAIQGYGNDTVSEATPINWNDRLHLLVYPVDHRNLKFWPENVPNFRETLDEYANEINKVNEKVLRAIATSLNLEENSFLKKCGNKDLPMFARFNYYPPCPYPDRVNGLGRHSDASVITVLQQDQQVEGLQVLRDNKWYKVPIIPDALFVTVGDQLEIMSNGALKSTEHKVVTNSERARISVAMPSSAGPAQEIGPLNELIDDDRPPLYKNIKNYPSMFFQNRARGVLRPINIVKI